MKLSMYKCEMMESVQECVSRQHQFFIDICTTTLVIQQRLCQVITLKAAVLDHHNVIMDYKQQLHCDTKGVPRILSRGGLDFPHEETTLLQGLLPDGFAVFSPDINRK